MRLARSADKRTNNHPPPTPPLSTPASITASDCDRITGLMGGGGGGLPLIQRLLNLLAPVLWQREESETSGVKGQRFFFFVGLLGSGRREDSSQRDDLAGGDLVSVGYCRTPRPKRRTKTRQAPNESRSRAKRSPRDAGPAWRGGEAPPARPATGCQSRGSFDRLEMVSGLPDETPRFRSLSVLGGRGPSFGNGAKVK